MLKKLTVV